MRAIDPREQRERIEHGPGTAEEKRAKIDALKIPERELCSTCGVRTEPCPRRARGEECEWTDFATTLHGISEAAALELKVVMEKLHEREAFLNPEHPDADEDGWVLPKADWAWLELLIKVARYNDIRRSHRM